MTNHWTDIFASNNIMSTEEDIINFLGEDVTNNTKKVTEAERNEMDADIKLTDIETVIRNLNQKKHLE